MRLRRIITTVYKSFIYKYFKKNPEKGLAFSAHIGYDIEKLALR